jgi:hypothetical protein
MTPLFRNAFVLFGVREKVCERLLCAIHVESPRPLADPHASQRFDRTKPEFTSLLQRDAFE